jgi:ribosomal protein S18 acetylase RimI-like enzyme
MAELRPDTPVTRPATARARESGELQVAPPDSEELARIARHLAALPAHGGAAVTEDEALGVLLVRQPGAGPAWNYAALPRWSTGGWRADLARVVDTIRDWGAWPSLLVADRLDRPIGLGGVLETSGWSAVVRETAMWVGHASPVPHLDSSMRIEAVQPSGVADHEALERRVFGMPASQAVERRGAMALALSDGRLRAWIVRVGEEPVAVARLSQGDRVAGIYGVGVAQAWRGRGYGTLITTVATRAGLALGNRVVWLSVDEDNLTALRVYRRLGFAPAFGWARWMLADGSRWRGS